MFIAPDYKEVNVTLASKVIDVMDAESDTGRNSLHRLDYETWLPFPPNLYQISPNISDYLIISMPICPSDIPNRNGIGFPLSELTKFQPPPISQMAYKAWKSAPVHYEHKNEIHEDAYGVILDSSLHKI